MNDSQVMDVYTIVYPEGPGVPFWVKLGTAFPNQDGTINAYLDALPVNGKLHIRPRSLKKDEEDS